MNLLQGIYEEYQSADIAVRSLILAERKATRFDRPGIRRALNEAINARTRLALELLDGMDAAVMEAERIAA